MDDYDEDPIDQTLRRLAGDPSPSAGDRERAWQAYTRATTGDNRTPIGRRLVLAATSVATVAALVVGFVAASSLRPPPAQGVLLEIARAAEQMDPLAIPEGQYAYTSSRRTDLGVTGLEPFPHRSTRIAYLIPKDRQNWISQEGVAQIITTVGEPMFFREADEVDYYAAGYDLFDEVGQTVTETLSNTTSILMERTWPTDPAELRDVIVGLIREDSERPKDVDILEKALDLIREVGPSPALRAAAIAVIAGLDLTIEDESPGQTMFSISWTNPEHTTKMFTLNSEGHLIEEIRIDNDGDPILGIPPGTRISHAIYEPTIITTRPPTG